MLTSKLIHPEIMSALAYCGHGSKVLIADGNYPLAEKTGNAKKVYLGLVPGMPTARKFCRPAGLAPSYSLLTEILLPGAAFADSRGSLKKIAQTLKSERS